MIPLNNLLEYSGWYIWDNIRFALCTGIVKFYLYINFWNSWDIQWDIYDGFFKIHSQTDFNNSLSSINLSIISLICHLFILIRIILPALVRSNGSELTEFWFNFIDTACSNRISCAHARSSLCLNHLLTIWCNAIRNLDVLNRRMVFLTIMYSVDRVNVHQ